MYFQLFGTNVRLLGSMHMFPAANPNMPAWVAQAYEWSESLVFESDPSTILPLFKSQAGQSLKGLLSPEVLSVLEAFWPTNGPLSPLNEMRPWAALLLAATLNQQTSEGVEPRFLRSVVENSKPFWFLETTQEVAAAFESVPLEEVQASLALLVSDLSAPQRMLNQMHIAWLQRDLKGVHDVASQSPSFAFPGIRSAILDRRNRAWAPVINDALENPERTLIVVGALHLYGQGNLIECLGRDADLVSTDG